MKTPRMTTKKIHRRGVKTRPTPMRFFQSSATAAGPVGVSLNHARLGFRFFPAVCQLPARTAATRVASFCEASSEASSNETSEPTTQT